MCEGPGQGAVEALGVTKGGSAVVVTALSMVKVVVVCVVWTEVAMEDDMDDKEMLSTANMSDCEAVTAPIVGVAAVELLAGPNQPPL
jgi:hypothetical protein